MYQNGIDIQCILEMIMDVLLILGLWCNSMRISTVSVHTTRVYVELQSIGSLDLEWPAATGS